MISADTAGNVVLRRADTAGKTTNPTRYFARDATGSDEMKKTKIDNQVDRLLRIEAAALAIDGIELSNCVEIPISAWEDLQAALYEKDNKEKTK